MSKRPLRLKAIEEKPYNAETPIQALAEPITPNELFYVRNHFEVPNVNLRNWRLAVRGQVGRPLKLSLTQLKRFPKRTLSVVMECAGNGRTLMKPTPAGSPWHYGAISGALFTGTALRNVLSRARPKADAVEVLFSGADEGNVEGLRLRFARSLPIEIAMHRDTLLAWAMNGVPLTPNHGFPLRLVVPRWYGVASVKWLANVDVLRAPFEGHFQTETYVYKGERGTPDGTPVSLIRVRSVIGSPVDGEEVRFGPVQIVGTAWSGAGSIARMEVSVDGGVFWGKASLAKAPSPCGATPWHYAWKPKGRGKHKLIARATDSAGNTQPLSSAWNALGYGNNVAHVISVIIR